ncbi:MULTISPECIES: SDR family oxidoreductase [Streptomyces]|uniref:SDR family oxidoreductase n=1 Tax=Streptomyces cinereoruber TaxID=67260 RepID=A0AAV4KHB7_9ACTN|nr:MULTISPECIES: SDR family oxidoreductase [Streptomyces]AVH97829.1 short-chain dehydrogenase [Streptomyces sp. WAC00288]KYG56420.1 short-chain dehydrogenase [Streptomyces sp. WAC04657]MBB4155943.1 NAD(P)-dependent dehydrogenase (short-subunit alcohol dehydrogenase family) [Streptomyces cinereoruber]MBY8816938.1 SDR family oxidoreductase [Streptomyces cinereoruber]NIH64754.1 NAD(P)-dependent dehydrogenase (short-subunit alcohol dehydrogenase family) [Streptomyces cinereoruber]
MSTETSDNKPLRGRICLVAGATRGAGRAIAVQLGTAGATVYVTGRTTREKVSEVGRTTETIEETAELVTAAGGEGIAVPTDHLEPDQVAALVDRIDRERGRLDVLVNDIWGGEHLVVAGFDKKIWEVDLADGLRMLELGVKSHLITSAAATPLLVRNPGGLLVEVTDGTQEYNGTRYRENVYYDLAKNAPIRMAFGLARELEPAGCTAVALTPGWLRSEQMLDHFGVTEENWRDAAEKLPDFAVAESPVYVGRAVAALAADPDRARWNGRSLSSGQLAKEYGFTDADGSRPDAWGFIIAKETDENVSVDDYR